MKKWKKKKKCLSTKRNEKRIQKQKATIKIEMDYYYYENV